ncbi:MAG: class I SAM-dependent methyltransferase, partial [Gemmatimonadota bacterium]
MREPLAALERRFVLGTAEVTLGGERITLEKPRTPDDLISEADFAHDERLPYWADLWPAAVVLADHLLTEQRLLGAADAPHRPRALELGCGIGLVTIAAMRAGYDVVATDYYEDALLFAARNALQDFLDALGPLGLTHRVVHQERRPVHPPAPEGSFAHHVLTVYEVRRSSPPHLRRRRSAQLLRDDLGDIEHRARGPLRLHPGGHQGQAEATGHRDGIGLR